MHLLTERFFLLCPLFGVSIIIKETNSSAACASKKISLSLSLSLPSATHVPQGEVADSCNWVTVFTKSSELIDLDTGVAQSQQVDDQEHVDLDNVVDLQLQTE